MTNYCGASPPSGHRATATCLIETGHRGPHKNGMDGTTWAQKKPTKKTLVALRIIQARGAEGIIPSEFAQELWPDSPYWKVVYKAGPNGSVSGRGVVMSGGSYLAKLRRMRLVTWHGKGNRYVNILTPEGQALLKEAQDGTA